MSYPTNPPHYDGGFLNKRLRIKRATSFPTTISSARIHFLYFLTKLQLNHNETHIYYRNTPHNLLLNFALLIDRKNDINGAFDKKMLLFLKATRNSNGRFWFVDITHILRRPIENNFDVCFTKYFSVWENVLMRKLYKTSRFNFKFIYLIYFHLSV